MIDLTIDNFEDALDYVVGLCGSDFERALATASALLADPEGFTGQQALNVAGKLSVYRYRMGIAAQLWKIKSAQTKKLEDRLIKDAYLVSYDALVEVINTLKLNGKYDHSLSEIKRDS